MERPTKSGPSESPENSAFNKCRGCQGLDQCKQDSKGMMPFEEKWHGITYTVLHMCRYGRQERSRAIYSRLFEEAKVPKKYATDTWKDYQVSGANRKAVEAAHDAVDNHKSLVLYGNRGTGKTKLAAIMANDLTQKGRPVLFSLVPDLLNAIRSRMDTGKSQELLDGIKDVDFLILDDMGSERMTTWVAEQLFIVINHRYNQDLPTVITTNYDPKLLMNRLSILGKEGKVVDRVPAERIMSRLKAMAEFVKVGGVDRREQYEK